MQMVPLRKQSKKARKAYHAERRGNWAGISPVTRVVPEKTDYDRRRDRKEPCRLGDETE